jgi:hypothetical protein
MLMAVDLFKHATIPDAHVQVVASSVCNIKHEASRHFRTERREYLKDKINELATNSKNIRDPYKGINKFKGATNLEILSQGCEW